MHGFARRIKVRIAYQIRPPNDQIAGSVRWEHPERRGTRASARCPRTSFDASWDPPGRRGAPRGSPSRRRALQGTGRNAALRDAERPTLAQGRGPARCPSPPAPSGHLASSRDSPSIAERGFLRQAARAVRLERRGVIVAGLGLILSGGGARGAYEVGALQYIFSEFLDSNGKGPKVDLISGTSVGAVNGAFVASSIGDVPSGVKQLVSIWTGLELPHVLGFGLRQAAGLYRVLLGGSGQARGVFDPGPLSALVGRNVRWRRLRQNIRSGALRALTVSTTHVGTGQPVIFVDAAPGLGIPESLGLHALVRRARIGQHHVLASAAIPLIFPPVEIGDEIHCDGGLRLNTPMGPSVHLGMNRLLVIGLSTPHSPDRRAVKDGKYPGATFMLGKVLNAFLLDHVNTDLLEVQRINDFLHDGVRAYGPEFVDRINAAAKARGALAERRLLSSLVLRPTVDIGQVASDYLASNRVRFGKSLGRAFISMLDVGAGADADLASYLLFDGGFAQTLIEMGRRDAHAQRDQIEAFLFEDPNAILAPPPTVDSMARSASKTPE
ncbi:MAG: hypothetical protein EX268_02215 [Deltaproteobacteria bacterium]|nr:MAG: hypothetical protein EX268_02215 [Deltaproteobacteria bacterium]